MANQTFRVLWIKEQYRKLRANPALNSITNDELKEYLLKKYETRRLVMGRLYNNATDDNCIMSQEEFINKYLNENFILSGYSCFFKNQNDSINISSAALSNLLDMRKINKKKMEAAEHGSNEYIYYRIIQLTYKVLANSYYGILGEKNSVFYNPFVQNSITMTGQDLITTAIIGMENFIANNIKFEDLDDLITFIVNVRTQKAEFNIIDYLDEPISKDELKEYLIGHCKYPDEIDKGIVNNYIDGLTPEQVSRCYYKNRVLDIIINNEWFKGKLRKMLQYVYSDTPAPEIVDDVEDLKAKIIDFCYYDYLIEDRYKRAMKDKRQAVITIDTDSVFINVNPHIEAISGVLDLTKEQESSLVNIFINITTEAIKRTMWNITENMGIIDEAKPIINMKQEFLYQRILLTQNKKNYAGIITAELGKTLSSPVMDVKGLPILKKTSVPKALRKQFNKIVEDDILKADKIDIKSILNKYDNIETQIANSLKNGETLYLLPKNIESIDTYKTPDTIEQVRAVLIWNALEPDSQIIPPEKLDLLKLNCFSENDPRLATLLDTHPDKYEAIMQTVFNHNVSTPKIDISRFGFSCVAIPKGTDKIPEYLLPFIDYKTMVNTNMQPSYILLESLGVYCDEFKTIKYKSNIISI